MVAYDWVSKAIVRASVTNEHASEIIDILENTQQRTSAYMRIGSSVPGAILAENKNFITPPKDNERHPLSDVPLLLVDGQIYFELHTQMVQRTDINDKLILFGADKAKFFRRLVRTNNHGVIERDGIYYATIKWVSLLHTATVAYVRLYIITRPSSLGFEACLATMNKEMRQILERVKVERTIKSQPSYDFVAVATHCFMHLKKWL